MSSHLGRTARAVLFLLTFNVVGCGSAGPRDFPVSGKVTLDGKPLEKGMVYFKTVQTGAVEVMDVVNGEFKGRAQEGNRRVEVYLFQTKMQNIDGMKSEVKQNLIPRQYNLDSKLTATVTPGGANEFTFDLNSK